MVIMTLENKTYRPTGKLLGWLEGLYESSGTQHLKENEIKMAQWMFCCCFGKRRAWFDLPNLMFGL